MIDPKNLAGTAHQVWGDEFNTLDWNTWRVFPKDGNPQDPDGGFGWGQEWIINPHTTSTGVNPYSVSNGVLSLAAAPASSAARPQINNMAYTSGAISTKGTQAFTAGDGTGFYVEGRIANAPGNGLWSAFWMMPTDGSWPPEIDMLENLGNDPGRMYQTLHYTQPNANAWYGGSGHAWGSVETVIADPYAFHTYGVDVQPDRTRFYIDGQLTWDIPTSAEHLQKSWFPVLSLSVGGWNGNQRDGSTAWPSRMLVDYVRVYEDGTGATPPPDPTPDPAPPQGKTFVFDSKTVKTVTFFDTAKDTLALDNSVFTRLVDGPLKPATFYASKRGTAHDRDDRILYNTSTGALYYDDDGKGGHAPIQIGIIQNKPLLNADDFVVT